MQSEKSSISTLIRNSSKLEKLVIHAFIDHTKPDSISLNEWDFTLHQLKEVKFVDVSGLKCELQFIELLLANSPAREIRFRTEIGESCGQRIIIFQRTIKIPARIASFQNRL